MKITVDMILAKNPCEGWTKSRIKKYIGKGKTIPECLKLLDVKDVSAADKIWTATQFFSDKMNREFAIWCARSCKTNIKEIKDYIDTIEKFYSGKATEKELNTAYSVAYRAAYIAADSAAYWAAGRAAYRDAERAVCKKQIAKLKKIIKREIGE